MSGKSSVERGKRWERECVKYFKLWSFDLERTKAGSFTDVGDLSGDDLCCYQAKDNKSASFSKTQADARKQADQSGKRVGVAIMKQPQKPTGDALVVLSLEDWMLVRSLIERETISGKANRVLGKFRSRVKRADPDYVAAERVKNAEAIKEKRRDAGFRQDEKNRQAILYADQDECARRARVQRQGAKRRARQFGAPMEDYVSPLLCPSAKCCCCGSMKRLTVDHIEPLHLGKNGKGDVLDNLQVYCHQCNASKGRGETCQLEH